MCQDVNPKMGEQWHWIWRLGKNQKLWKKPPLIFLKRGTQSERPGIEEEEEEEEEEEGIFRPLLHEMARQRECGGS